METIVLIGLQIFPEIIGLNHMVKIKTQQMQTRELLMLMQRNLESTHQHPWIIKRGGEIIYLCCI